VVGHGGNSLLKLESPFVVVRPYETLPGVTETPGNGVFFSGETPPDTARYTPIWQPQVSLCSMPVLVVNRPL
jgi:hypothetical protein